MGELREPWHTKQVELLDRHLHLLHLYSQAKENLAAYKGKKNISRHLYLFYNTYNSFAVYKNNFIMKLSFSRRIRNVCREKRV